MPGLFGGRIGPRLPIHLFGNIKLFKVSVDRTMEL